MRPFLTLADLEDIIALLDEQIEKVIAETFRNSPVEINIGIKVKDNKIFTFLEIERILRATERSWKPIGFRLKYSFIPEIRQQ